MATRRETHEAAAKHHLEMCKCHETWGKGQAEMAEESGEKVYATNAAMHKRAAASHQMMADHHAECAKSVEADDLEKRLIPVPGIRGIYSSDNTTRAVPRHGAPNPDTDLERAPLEFRHLVSIDESL